MSSLPEAGPSPTPGARPAASGGLPIARWLATPEASVIIVLIALLVLMVPTGKLGQFGDPNNQVNVWRSIGMQSVMGVGVLLVILTGGIDLSLGSMVAFSGMVLAVVAARLADGGMNLGMATLIAIGCVLLFSLLLGFLHATLVHQLRLPSFVVTLASMSMLRSGALLMNNAVPVVIDRFELLKTLGNKQLYIAGTPIGLPIPFIILAIIALAIGAILNFTQIGRQVYSVGSNEEASRLSGVNVFKVRLFVYGACSLLAGIAGILYTGYGGQGDPSSGVMFELNAISAAVIGGAALTGGRGSVLGTVLGAVLLEWILSMINLTLSNPTLWRGLVVGGVLLAAVVLNQLRQRKTGRV